MAREAIVGLSLGLGLRVLISAAELGGWLTGFQLGFSYASIVDPQTGARNGVVASIYGMTALMAFFAADGHHLFLRALVTSYEAVPIGAGQVEGTIGVSVARMLGVVFYTGAQLAAPVVVVLLVVELGLGLASRAAPMLNLMAQGFPIRILVGLLALAAMVRIIPPVIRRAMPVAIDLASRLAMAFQ
jgi:flagellar biosynthetic protein FliR